jgi:hypothetical protein
MIPRETLINNTIKNLNRLPDEKLREISDFIEFLLTRLNDQLIIGSIQENIQNSTSYTFLKEEKDIYTVNDLKEKYK